MLIVLHMVSIFQNRLNSRVSWFPRKGRALTFKESFDGSKVKVWGQMGEWSMWRMWTHFTRKGVNCPFPVPLSTLTSPPLQCTVHVSQCIVVPCWAVTYAQSFAFLHCDCEACHQQCHQFYLCVCAPLYLRHTSVTSYLCSNANFRSSPFQAFIAIVTPPLI